MYSFLVPSFLTSANPLEVQFVPKLLFPPFTLNCSPTNQGVVGFAEDTPRMLGILYGMEERSRQREERSVAQNNAREDRSVTLFNHLIATAQRVDGRIEKVEDKVVEVGDKVVENGDKVEGVREELGALAEQVKSNKFKEGMAGRIYPLLNAMVDTETGWMCWQPRGFTGSNGVYSEHVVLNVPMIAHFCLKEFPDAIPSEDVEVFFRTSSLFPRSPTLPYPDFIDFLVLCGCRHLAIGPHGNSMENEMRKRFIMIQLAPFKEKLLEIGQVFGDEMVDRDPGWRKPRYEAFGNTYAYASASERAYISAIRRPMSLEEARQIPAMLYPCVKENFTPEFRDFFGMPPFGEGGNHHVVNGRFKPDSAPVVSHAEALEAIAKKKTAEREDRRKARFSKRQGEGAGPQKKEPKKSGGSRRGRKG